MSPTYSISSSIDLTASRLRLRRRSTKKATIDRFAIVGDFNPDVLPALPAPEACQFRAAFNATSDIIQLTKRHHIQSCKIHDEVLSIGTVMMDTLLEVFGLLAELANDAECHHAHRLNQTRTAVEVSRV